MSSTAATAQAIARLADEIGALRAELSAARAELGGRLDQMARRMDELGRIERMEEQIEDDLIDVADRLDRALEGGQPSLGICESCGAPVERHPAEQGVLLICRACGHSAFVDRRIIGERRRTTDRRMTCPAGTEGTANPATEPQSDWTKDAAP
jgi:rubrerythrin